MITATAITNIRSATSHDVDDQISNAQYLAWLQVEQDRLRFKLSAAVPTLYNTVYSPGAYVLTGSTVTLAKPSNFLATVRLEKLFGSRYFPIQTGDGYDVSGIQRGLEVREESGNFIVAPVENAPGTYRLTYVSTGATLVLTPKAVRVATAAALPAHTGAGAGVGATLTATGVGVLTVDGAATVLADRILVLPGHTSTGRAGIYSVTTEGTAGAAFVLTRATDFDQATGGEIETAAAIRPTAGSANINKTYVLTTTGTITVDTTALTFTEYASGAVTDSIEVPTGLEEVVTERVAVRVRERTNEDPSLHIRRADEVWKEVLPVIKRRYGAHPLVGFRRVRGVLNVES